MAKKHKIIILFVVVLVFMSAVLYYKNPQPPTADNGYFYNNKDLGFSLSLPKEFVYFQTQRINTPNYVDLEFFIPTSDVDFPKEVPGYAKFLVIRTYSSKPGQIPEEFTALKGSTGRTYAYKFWLSVPNDWQGKWGWSLGERIIKSIKFI